ncbi:vitellogenin-3-like [Ochlerotatus camptorhynchus]|uniref:vitellogenin-3-like n=1 Tax=Ochlerotatus camptorhynchus TaxID=644619 RepID=UPI0031D16968
MVSNVPMLLPSLQEVREFGKQSILGYPLEAVTLGIHSFCSAAVASNGTEPYYEPDLSRMNYVLMTESGNFTYSLSQAQDLWESSEFFKDLDTVVVVTGWLTSINDTNDAAFELYKAYHARGGYNFIVIDTASQLTSLYTWSSFNTNNLGNALGQGLAKLVNYVPLASIHVIGHSLGAHISGAAGRQFQTLTGQNLPRITGLDPANPCFNEGESLSGLSRGDASWVDVIHSNVRILGKRAPIGDIDFYPNGLNSIQPGCLTVICSHSRSWQYYAESVYPENEENFIGVKCNSLSAVDDGLCKSQTAIMGFKVSQKAKGNFFLRVNSQSPYGRKGTN